MTENRRAVVDMTQGSWLDTAVPITTMMKGPIQGVPVGGGISLRAGATIRATDVSWLPYNVALETELVGDRYLCTEVICSQREGGDPVTTNGLRAVPLGRLIAAGLQDTVMKSWPIPNTEGEFMVEPVGTWSDDTVNVAAIYRLAYACGLNPTSEVAAALGVSKSVASNRVMKARRAGLLDPTEKGKARAGGPS